MHLKKPELGYPQGPTPIQTNNTTAASIANCTVKIHCRTKAMAPDTIITLPPFQHILPSVLYLLAHNMIPYCEKWRGPTFSSKRFGVRSWVSGGTTLTGTVWYYSKVTIHITKDDYVGSTDSDSSRMALSGCQLLPSIRKHWEGVKFFHPSEGVFLTSTKWDKDWVWSEHLRIDRRGCTLPTPDCYFNMSLIISCKWIFISFFFLSEKYLLTKHPQGQNIPLP